MNRLALAQRAKLEMGIAGAASLTSTTAPVGIDIKIVNWVDDAFKRIQQNKLWSWMWESATVTILATTYTTAGTIAERRYIKDSCRDANAAPLQFMPWGTFRHAYPPALIATGTPSVWTIRPDKSFTVNAKPASNAALSVERYKAPVVMTLDADVPTGMPSELHMAIVWRAVMFYCGHDEAGTLYQHANNEYRKLMATAGAEEEDRPTWGDSW
jgi:hypothetical protein